MTQVATYVFTDLETTGLPPYEYNKTRITELSMVVVRRRHILDSPGAAPRVQEKLTLCFDPRKLIHPESSAVTGLDNDLLEHQTPFNINVFNTINSFLQCLEKPVCLVAQNGHNFDFPILKNHFEKLGVSLPDDILCTDSLHAFYDIESGRNWDNTSKAGVTVVDHKTNGVKADEASGDQKQNNQTSDKVVNGQVCNGLLVLTGVLWGCTNPFIRQGTKGLRDVTSTTVLGQVWAEVTFLLGNWKYVLPWLVNQAGSLSYLAAVQRAPLSVAVPVANSLAFVFTAVTGAGIGAEEPLDKRSILGIVLIMAGTALCCFDDTS